MAQVSFQCPGCRRAKRVSELVFWNTGEWGCPQCNHSAARAAWFAATPAVTLPQDTYFYLGAKTQNTKWRPMQGKIRKDLFAGGNLANIRDATPLSGVVVSQGRPQMYQGQGVTIHLAADGETLKGWFFTPPHVQTDKVILVLSGSGRAARRYCRPIVEGYAGIGARCLVVDYRGFGSSTGTPSSRGTYSDAEAMLAYLEAPAPMGGRGIERGKVVAHGYSLGSGPATELCVRTRQDSIAGLVLHCPMANSGTNASQAVGGGKLGAVAKKVTNWAFAYDNLHKIGTLRLPIHVVTGATDDMAPQGVELKRRAHPWTTDHRYNGGHMDQGLIFASGDLARFIVGLP